MRLKHTLTFIKQIFFGNGFSYTNWILVNFKLIWKQHDYILLEQHINFEQIWTQNLLEQNYTILQIISSAQKKYSKQKYITKITAVVLASDAKEAVR